MYLPLNRSLDQCLLLNSGLHVGGRRVRLHPLVNVVERNHNDHSWLWRHLPKDKHGENGGGILLDHGRPHSFTTAAGRCPQLSTGRAV